MKLSLRTLFPFLLAMGAAGAAAACSSDPLTAIVNAAAEDASVPEEDGSIGSDAAADSGKDSAKVDTGTEEKESCSADGWCTVPPSVVSGVGGFLDIDRTEDGTTFAASYGVYRTVGATWKHYDLTWPDLFDKFIVRNHLFAIKAFTTNDVWVGGEQGYVAHFDGSVWTPATQINSDVSAIGGAAANDVWMFDSSGRRFHNTGSGFVADASKTNARVAGIHAKAANDLWAYGILKAEDGGVYEQTGALHFDGATWNRVPIPTTHNVIASLWAGAANDIWAVGSSGVLGGSDLFHFNGSTWSKVAGVTSPRAIWGAAANDVYVVGYGGTVMHWNGSAWATQSVGKSELLLTIDGTTASDVWIGGSGTVYRKK
jgi:hypothetical protein